MTKVSYTINGTTTTDYAQACAMGWKDWMGVTYTDIIEDNGRTAEQRADHIARVDNYLAQKRA